MFIIDFVVWIDRLFVQSLRHVIPDLDSLLADPAGRLSEGAIVIGPRKNYAKVGFASLLAVPSAALAVTIFFLALLDTNRGPIAQRPDAGFLLVIELVAVLVGALLTVWLLSWIWRGGKVVLTREGVKLHRGRSVVYLPWALFNRDPAQFSLKGGGEVFLLANPRAIPLVELEVDGQRVAQGEAVRNCLFQFVPPNKARIKFLSVASTRELTELLLHLSQVLTGPAVVLAPGEDGEERAQVGEGKPVPPGLARN